ncbi:MAG: alpha/beta fold hydrolase, partial [Candidatus Rokuibacteriota bacterium]
MPLIRCPTIVIAGRQDAIFPVAEHEFMVSQIPPARLAVIEDCGHGALGAAAGGHGAAAILADLLLRRGRPASARLGVPEALGVVPRRVAQERACA